ncbi:MAG: DoxX family protein [Flavobacteriaceae bacterium]
MLKFEKFLDRHRDFGIFLLRLFIGGRLLYGVIDNVLSWDRMIEFADFLGSNAFPYPLISAITSVYVQFLGAILILIGFKLRIAAMLLIINFIVALTAFHLRVNDSIEAMTPALAMLFGCLTLLFIGAGKISIENYLRHKLNK